MILNDQASGRISSMNQNKRSANDITYAILKFNLENRVKIPRINNE